VSYIPYRDRFGFNEATAEALDVIAGDIEASAATAYVEEECGDPDGCTHGCERYTPGVHEVLCDLVERGLLNVDAALRSVRQTA